MGLQCGPINTYLLLLPCNVLALATTYIRDLKNGRDARCKDYPINHLMRRLL